MLEDDVRVLSDELSDLLAEAAELFRVLLIFFPEPVALGLAIDHVFATDLLEQRDLLRRRHDADRDRPTVEAVLHGIASETPGRAPHQDDIALFHLRAVR